jgi:hypothetical protein
MHATGATDAYWNSICPHFQEEIGRGVSPFSSYVLRQLVECFVILWRMLFSRTFCEWETQVHGSGKISQFGNAS